MAHGRLRRAIIGAIGLTLAMGIESRGDPQVLFRPIASLAATSPNRLTDPGFEQVGTGPSDWHAFEKGFDVDKDVRSEGRQSIRCHADDTNTSLGARAVFQLNHTRVVPIRIAVHTKCKDVPGTPTPGYSIYVDLIHTDGTPTWGLIKPLPTGTHDWRQHTLTIVPNKPIRAMSLHLLLRGVRGTVWFDDATVSIYDQADVRIFDGQPVELADSAATAKHESRPVRLADDQGGLQLLGDPSSGDVTNVSVPGKSIPPGPLAGGVFLQDVGAGGPVCRVAGKVDAGGGKTVVAAALEPLAMDVSATWTADKGRITGRVDLHARDQRERALSLVVAVPVDLRGGQWFDDARRRRPIEPGRSYCNAARMNVGKTGTSSMYPFAAVTKDNVGLAIAVPLDEPRIVRLAYDAEHQWLYAAFDLALSPDPVKLPGRARLDFELYTFDPKWGFRAALQRYYDLHPDAFKRRVDDVGLWMAFAKISAVERPEDFGFYFKEGLGDQTYDNAHGILTFRYTEPQTHWLSMPKDMERSDDQAVNYLTKLSREADAPTRRICAATLTSAAKKADGQYWLWLLDTPWCNGAVFALNPDPDLPGDVTKAKLNYDPAQAAKLYRDAPDAGVDGEYLDSLDGWCYQQNYRREHFRTVDVPLVYDTETRRTCIINAFSIWEYVRWVGKHVHDSGKLMMANTTPTYYPWQVAHLDVMGQEHNWNPGGRWQPMSDAELLYRRSLCATKPYLLLQNSDFAQWTERHTRWYLMRAGAYGVQPSFFSANASTDHYFTKPAWYNRDRPLFKQLIPIIRRIGRAGWSPVTLARSDKASLQVERFGQAGGSECFLTIHNPGDQTASGVIRLEPNLRAATAEDMLSHKPIPIAPDPAECRFSVSVPAHEALFVHLRR
ncbi:MAG: hypothetical protein JXQ73_32475 [Phycisphaerae bacterium]|nr:hypothetical protein [Phycisphaerae bacterium]